MIDIGIGMMFAFMASLCVGGLLAWGWTFYRLWNRLPVYPPEPRLPANWGFAEFLLCLGVYVLLAGLFAIVLMGSGFASQPASHDDVATIVVDELTNSSSVPDQASTPDDATTPINTETQVAFMTVDSASKLLAVVVVLALMLIQDRKIVQRFGWIPCWRDIALGIVASCMLLPLTFLIQAGLSQFVPYEHPVLEIISSAPPEWMLWAMAFTSMIVAPLVEEFFFRGVLQGWFQRLAAPTQPLCETALTDVPRTANEVVAAPMDGPYMDGPYAPPPSFQIRAPGELSSEQVSRWPWWPIIVSSLLFALVHWGHGAAPIALFFFALGLGFLYRITGRLWASITVHFILNTISTLMTLMGT